ncbi:hypothetical protein ACFWSF_10645 [Streptomyces sp. NPDC058611]|uniref:hypothetical protein n=1 Tax=unclassified Streptomyces TaxID=2593676 RepID=UPI003653AC7C
MTIPGAKTAVEWLVSAAPDPGACRREWERSPLGAALLPAGRRWDVLIVPAELGQSTLDVLGFLVDRPGPVLADFGAARPSGTPMPRLGFFVPPGTASRWIGTGVRGAGRGTWIVVPYPGRAAGGVRWLVLPDGRGTLTDPAVLELAMHEAAATVAHGAEAGAAGTGVAGTKVAGAGGAGAPGSAGSTAPGSAGSDGSAGAAFPVDARAAAEERAGRKR